MKISTSIDTFVPEVLAKSLSMRLTLEEVEWLCRELKKQSEEKRLQADYESLVRTS
jgi:hypothetical protein